MKRTGQDGQAPQTRARGAPSDESPATDLVHVPLYPPTLSPTGSRIVNVVPLRLRFQRSAEPRCLVATMERAMARPWPLPLPTPLV